MKQMFKKGMVALILAVLALPLGMASQAQAWGPERQTYTMQAPADHATFNSITDNALIGDERDFVRIVEKGTENEYSSDLTIEPGKQYIVYIYYHNDASETYNTTAHNQVGVAKEVRLMSNFPDELAKNERQAITGRISSTSTTPEAVWDEAYVTAKEALTLHYVEGSAKIYNHWFQDGKLLSTKLFSEEGTFLGTSEMNGIIFGCDRFSGSVRYTIQAVANGTPEEPEVPGEPDVPVTPTDPEIPKELPKTGPVEIILGIVIIGAILAAVLYWRKTHKDVKKATKKARGRK